MFYLHAVSVHNSLMLMDTSLNFIKKNFHWNTQISPWHYPTSAMRELGRTMYLQCSYAHTRRLLLSRRHLVRQIKIWRVRSKTHPKRRNNRWQGSEREMTWNDLTFLMHFLGDNYILPWLGWGEGGFTGLLPRDTLLIIIIRRI